MSHDPSISSIRSGSRSVDSRSALGASSWRGPSLRDGRGRGLQPTTWVTGRKVANSVIDTNGAGPERPARHRSTRTSGAHRLPSTVLLPRHTADVRPPMKVATRRDICSSSHPIKSRRADARRRCVGAVAEVVLEIVQLPENVSGRQSGRRRIFRATTPV